MSNYPIQPNISKMTTTNNFSENSFLKRSIKGEDETLLSKYRIPIQHFEYDYIEKCSDGKELEKILLVLRSGEEGHYPDLINATEERLTVVKPKSKLLKKVSRVFDKQDLRKDELQEISEDLNKFVQQISKNDKELDKRKIKANYHEVDVRSFKEFKNDEKPAKDVEKKISSMDYRAWDEYDPDTELLKMDLKEEKDKKSLSELRKQSKPKKVVTFNQFATEAEAIFHSDREKEKGNEFFKTCDYSEALMCYNNSVQMKANVNNLNNRALTHLKLKNYKDALRDCEKVLSLEGNNLKAYLRKAEALEKLQRYEEASDCVDFVIQRDPNNCSAQELAEKLIGQRSKVLKSTRLTIMEID